MRKLYSIIKRNLIIFGNSKISILFLILGPIVLMFIMGTGLSNTDLKSIPTAIYIENGGNFTNQFVDELWANSFDLSYTSSLYECINFVKTSKKRLCIVLTNGDVLPSDKLGSYKEELENYGGGYRVDLYVDFSQPRIVWSMISKVNSVVEKFSDGLRMGLTQNLRDELKVYSIKVDYQLENLDGIIDELLLIESDLRVIEGNIPKDNEVEMMISSIASIDLEIKRLKESIPTYSYLFDDLERSFESFENNFHQLNLDDVSQLSNLIYSVRKSIRLRVQTLRTIKGELKSINDNLKKIETFNWDYILYPIPMSYTAISGRDFNTGGSKLSFLDYLFPSVLGFFILLNSMLLSTNLRFREKNSAAYVRNILGKTSKLTLIIGDFITIYLIVFIQTLLLIFVASYFLNFSIQNTPYFLVIVTLLSIPIFIFLGAIISNFFKSHEMTTVTLILISLSMIIFSSLITPIDSLPFLFKKIISLSPLVITENLFRSVFIFQSTIYENLTSLIKLFIITLITFGIAIFSDYYTRKKGS